MNFPTIPGGFRALGLVSLLALSACVSTEDRVSQQGDRLIAAGFIQKPANTPERRDMLNHLPPHTMVRQVSGDNVSFVFADPLVCNCIFVGSQAAYGRYQRYLQARRLVNEQRQTAMLYADPAWNWGPWGPWGPGWRPGFGVRRF